MNENIMLQLPRTVDYYNDIVTLSENLEILSNPQGGRSSLKIVFTYIKSLLQSQVTDKVFKTHNFIA